MNKTLSSIKIISVSLFLIIALSSCINTINNDSYIDYSERILKMKKSFIGKEIEGIEKIIPQKVRTSKNPLGVLLIYRKTDCTSCINKAIEVINKYSNKFAFNYMVDSSLPCNCGMQKLKQQAIKDTASVILNQLNNCPTPLLLSIDAKNRIDNLFIIFPHDKPDNIQKLFITNLIKDEE